VLLAEAVGNVFVLFDEPGAGQVDEVTPRTHGLRGQGEQTNLQAHRVAELGRRIAQACVRVAPPRARRRTRRVDQDPIEPPVRPDLAGELGHRVPVEAQGADVGHACPADAHAQRVELVGADVGGIDDAFVAQGRGDLQRLAPCSGTGVPYEVARSAGDPGAGELTAEILHLEQTLAVGVGHEQTFLARDAQGAVLLGDGEAIGREARCGITARSRTQPEGGRLVLRRQEPPGVETAQGLAPHEGRREPRRHAGTQEPRRRCPQAGQRLEDRGRVPTHVGRCGGMTGELTDPADEHVLIDTAQDAEQIRWARDLIVERAEGLVRRVREERIAPRGVEQEPLAEQGEHAESLRREHPGGQALSFRGIGLLLRPDVIRQKTVEGRGDGAGVEPRREQRPLGGGAGRRRGRGAAGGASGRGSGASVLHRRAMPPGAGPGQRRASGRRRFSRARDGAAVRARGLSPKKQPDVLPPATAATTAPCRRGPKERRVCPARLPGAVSVKVVAARKFLMPRPSRCGEPGRG
jgi:hypothetical protein